MSADARPPTLPARYSPLPQDLAGNPAAAEEAVLALWRAENTFQELQAARRGAPAFVFWEGPPTANGRPGIHHVLARTLKDAVCRTRSMLGFRVERKAGWDTHGLPVELQVEKALGIDGKKAIEGFGVAKFNAKCRESVWQYKEEWERLSERIAYWLDYAHPYVTYERDYIDSVWYLLSRFHAKGLVYRGRRVLPYCGRCGTGLSSHELGQPGVYRDVLDPSITVRFRLKPPPGVAPEEPESFLAWTTTPWTLPSNFALAVHPDLEYVRARITAKDGSTEIVWVAADRAQAVLGDEHEVLGRKQGRELVGTAYQPLFGLYPDVTVFPVPDSSAKGMHHIFGGEFVTAEEGTGIVHQAPYGVDDWDLATRERVHTLMAVGTEGRFIVPVSNQKQEEIPGLGPDAKTVVVESGTFFKEADERLMDDLKNRKLLFKKARETHSYPHCWRCDTPLFYFPTHAWYIRTTAYKDAMLAANAKVNWLPPEAGDKRFGEWLQNNVDWNISRDRYWGTPLPFWTCGVCAHDLAVESAAHLERLAGKLPVGFDGHKPGVDEVTFPCPQAGCHGKMRRTPAVLDCWFDSGAMPFAQHGWPKNRELVLEQFPADFICEGLDQTRGWFYTLHAIGTFVQDVDKTLGTPRGPTYRACLVNGLVLDKDGVKMSKRLGNVVDPTAVIKEHGADAVRWYLVAAAAPWLPKRFDPNGILEARRRFFGTLHNSYAFLREYARLVGFDADASDVPGVAERPEIDRWLVSRTQSLVATVRRCYEEIDLTGAARAIEGFVVDELSNWYIRRNRRRVWDCEPAALATLHTALCTSALLVAPLAPFVAEILWRRLEPGEGSVHCRELPRPDESLAEPELEAAMEIVQRIVVMGRALRERAGLRVRQPLRALHVRTPDEKSLALLSKPFATAQILDELNIKGWGSLAPDDHELCRLVAKPNFKILGKRLGGRMKAAAQRIGGLGTPELARLRAGETIEIDLDGEALSLEPLEVEIQVQSQAAFDVEADGRFVVWLDTQLDEGLVLEGLTREVCSRVNGLRKERGLQVEDRIHLWLDPRGDALLQRALERHRDLIAAETLATRIEVGAVRGEAAQLELGDGHVLACALERAPA